MDSFARGLKNAARMIEEGILKKHLQIRYSSFNEDIGARIANGTATLEECEVRVEVAR
jgi:xylose isomerase